MNTKNRIQRSALILAFAASTLALSACQNLSSPPCVLTARSTTATPRPSSW